jgi:hypothetical protein
MRTLQAASEDFTLNFLVRLAPSVARISISRTGHQNTPKVIYGFRGILIIRRSGTACVARMGSVSPLGDRRARSSGGERANFREAKFPCSTYAYNGSPKKLARSLEMSCAPALFFNQLVQQK